MTDDTLDGTETDSTVSRRRFLGATALAAGGLALGASVTGFGAASEGTMFTLRIENVSTGLTLTTTDEEAAEQPVPLSPGAWAVHRDGEPLFTPGEMERNNGLEEIAEDGSPMRLAEALGHDEHVRHSGAFTTPVGADGPAPIGPGGVYEVEFEAGAGDYLSFATMFVPSNDLFYAPDPEGIALFARDGDAVSGNVTDLVALWDAGTEINEEPGVGENQVQRQRGAGVGLVERGTVAAVEDVNGYEYPAVADVIRVTLSTE
ncbi:spondin domain-containing protein [Halomarina oriensis]|uniref:Uncharacterized protein n=1 Tax=Halomarina oriensis TaxID=671145 RepID=A0A6B0GQ01_9EURY|nr:spondin domain-containing protein [Halomarina oriensis]MWG34195.1 hypothetical protein [Halomarina oriensis]